jgi:hypothetical protein
MYFHNINGILRSNELEGFSFMLTKKKFYFSDCGKSYIITLLNIILRLKKIANSFFVRLREKNFCMRFFPLRCLRKKKELFSE